MSDFIIEDFVPETAPNPYTEHVAALQKAGEGKRLTIIVARGQKRDGTPGDGSKDKLAFQQAANAIGHTARVVKEEVQEDDTKIALSFILTAKQKRGAAKTEEVATPEVETAPEAEAAPEAEVAPEVEANRRHGRR